MKTKKWLTTLGLTSMLVGSLLTGCSGDKEKSVKTASEKNEKVEITLAGWGSSPEESALLKEVLADFEQEHPNIKVKHEVIADQYMDVM